ncbi:MAG: anti-sigma factor [Acidimicrobiales bacterium]
MSPVTGRQHSERHPLDDLALYALDALEGGEADEVEAHLAVCASCRQELAAHEEALGALVEDGPPPALWDAVQSQIRAGDTAPMHGTPPRPVGPAPAHHDRSARRRGMRRRLALLAAAAAVVAVVGVGVGSRLGNDGNGSGTLAVLADAFGADVARVVSNDDGDLLMLEKLPPLAAQHTYQLWSVGGPRPVSLGLLGDGHDEAVPVTLPAETAKLAISEEPAGGSTTPTGPIVASGAVVRPA